MRVIKYFFDILKIEGLSVLFIRLKLSKYTPFLFARKEKGRDLIQSYDPKKNEVTTKNATKNFDYTTIADRLRTVSWSINWFTGSHHSHLPQKL